MLLSRNWQTHAQLAEEPDNEELQVLAANLEVSRRRGDGREMRCVHPH